RCVSAASSRRCTRSCGGAPSRSWRNGGAMTRRGAKSPSSSPRLSPRHPIPKTPWNWRASWGRRARRRRPRPGRQPRRRGWPAVRSTTDSSGEELVAASGADSLALEVGDVLLGTAKGASTGHLAQDDVRSLHRDEDVIPLPDVEQASGFSRYHDPTQVVDLACDASVHGSLWSW